MGDSRVNRKFVGNDIGIRNVLEATPATAQIICPLTMGDPDIGNEVELWKPNYIHSGFILPFPGVIEEIAFFAQGSTGTADPVTVKAAICAIAPTSETNCVGATIAEVLEVISNAAVPGNVSGLVTVGTGLSIAVPEMLTIGLKAPFGVSGVNGQAGLSAGPIPGVVGVYEGPAIMSVAGYFGPKTVTYGLNPPEDETTGKMLASTYKMPCMYIKWRVR